MWKKTKVELLLGRINQELAKPSYLHHYTLNLFLSHLYPVKGKKNT